ncbi:MAG: HAD family hydrolase [Bacteriovoracaceae bacterium]
MKKSSLAEIRKLLDTRHFQSVSFDIDGTVYPIRKIQMRWWKNFFLTPMRASRFYNIKKTWETRRKGDGVPALAEDVKFFEEFLTGMMDESLVDPDVKKWIGELKAKGTKIFFLSDHGAAEKLLRLGLWELGTPINCLTETGELKPHVKISKLLSEKYAIGPQSHLHLGDRWTDEEQAKLFGCEFRYFEP